MNSALGEFKESLDGAAVVVDEIDAKIAGALADPRTRALTTYQSCGVVVLLSGYFEEFLRKLISGYCRELTLRGVPFSALPETMRHLHYERGGYVLNEIARAHKSSGSTFWKLRPLSQLTRQLDSATYPAGSVTELIWESFVEVGENPGGDTVRFTLKNLGIEKPWPAIEAHASNPAWPTSRFTLVLKDFKEVRNNCAHTGQVSPVPPTGKLRDFIDMFRVLGAALVSLLSDRVTSMTPISSLPDLPQARAISGRLIGVLAARSRGEGRASHITKRSQVAKPWGGGARPLP